MKPEFIEGNTFKMVIPINEKMMAKMVGGGVIDGVYGGISGGAVEGAVEGAIEGATMEVKKKIIALVELIYKEPGKKTKEYANNLNIPQKSIERYIKILREKNVIIYKGTATQTGGYYLTEQMEKKLTQ